MSPLAKAIETMKAIRYNGNVSQYGWAFEDGSVKECDYNGCHSQILSYPKTPIAAYSFGPNIPDIRLQYIFDQTVSPWRSLIDGLGSRIEDIKNGSPFIYECLNVDANIIVNHMVSVRWPAEQIWSYAIWERLLRSGVHPAVADLLAAFCRSRIHWKTNGPVDLDHPEFTTYQYMHSNFVALDCTMEYADNFVRGKMTGGNGNPFAKTQTTGCANDYEKSSKSRGYKPIIGAFAKFDQMTFLDTMQGKMGPYMQFLVDTYGPVKEFNDLVRMGIAEQKRFELDDWHPGKRYAEAGVCETPCGVELSQTAIDAYERRRDGQSHWNYVQRAGEHQF